MAATITEISVRGYKSIERLDRFPLRPMNVLVGPNGAGKSNFVGCVTLLRELADRRLQLHVQIAGGADALLHLGPKVTREVSLRVLLDGGLSYGVGLVPTADNRLVVAREQMYTGVNADTGTGYGPVMLSNDDPTETSQSGVAGQPPGGSFTPVHVARRIRQQIAGVVDYHFDDTSTSAGVRRGGGINDDERLRPDASNLAAFLHRIRVTHPDHLERIRDVVRLAAPFFDDFKLRPIPTNPDMIQLEWTQRGTDYPFRPSQLSDGTLRFICLATALLQPDPPAVIMFDEPELGLHPYALTLLAALFRQVAAGPSQVIVSTQSATLLNEFDAEDVIVVERADGASTFRRLDPAALSEWLDDYAVGDLLQKNVFGGRPTPEGGGRP